MAEEWVVVPVELVGAEEHSLKHCFRKYLGALEKLMTDSWQKVMTMYKEHKNQMDLRTAAYLIAVKRILDAERLRGHLN